MENKLNIDKVELSKYVFFSKEDYTSRIKYYKLQAAIIDKLNKNGYAFIFDEPGAGKTIQGIYSIWNVLVNKKKDEYSNILIIAPNEQVAIKWKEEISSFLKLHFNIVSNREGNCSHRFEMQKDNFYITYNSKNYNNLGITRLTEFNEGLMYCSEWDLLILDEAHDYFGGYLKALYSEIVELKNRRYYEKYLSWHESDKILILTATPINYKMNDNLELIKEIPKKLHSNKENLNIPDLNIKNLLEFDSNTPYQRYFKEVVINKNSTRNRQVEFLEYNVSKRMKDLWTMCDSVYYQHCYGNIFLLLETLKNNNLITDEEKNILNTYDKSQYSIKDIENLKKIDAKLECFIKSILNNTNGIKCVIFVKQTQTQIFLEKILSVYRIKVFNLNSNLNSEERTSLVNKFNDYKEDKVVISTWSLGNYGINMHGADTVMCYECSSLLNQIEQGFGRIDRINKGYDNLKLILFKTADNYCYYDNYRIAIIYSRLFTNHLPNIPTKNILFTAEYINKYVDDVRKKVSNYRKLKNGIKSKTLNYLPEKDKLENENKSINRLEIKEICLQYNLDYDEFKYELNIYEEGVKYKRIIKELESYKELQKKIDNLIDQAKKSGSLGDSISDILGKAIYYYEDGMLKVTSIEELLTKADQYTFDEQKIFEENLELLSQNDMKILMKDVNDTEKLNSTLKKAILNKLDEHKNIGW